MSTLSYLCLIYLWSPVFPVGCTWVRVVRYPAQKFAIVGPVYWFGFPFKIISELPVSIMSASFPVPCAA